MPTFGTPLPSFKTVITEGTGKFTVPANGAVIMPLVWEYPLQLKEYVNCAPEFMYKVAIPLESVRPLVIKAPPREAYALTSIPATPATASRIVIAEGSA